MTIDWIELSRAIPYAGIAVVFAVFVLLLLERQDKTSVERQKLADAKDATRDAVFLAGINKQADDWRVYLREERDLDREARNQGQARLGEEIKGIALAVSATHALISQHDIWERTFVEHASAARLEKG